MTKSKKTTTNEDVPAANLRRTLKTAGVFGKIFLKGLEERLGKEPDHQKLAEALTKDLGAFKGPLMKIGQILATVPGMLPPAYAEAFLTLSNQAPPMGPLFMKRRMAAELGADWQAKFKTFDPKPVFAASLGQIHKAQTLKGETVAVKLQYPHMEEVIATDLRHLAFVCRLYERFGKALLTQNLQAELKDRLYEELDYAQEARHATWFQAALQDEEGVLVPSVYPSLSTKRLLTLSWLEGVPLLQFQKASQRVREKLGLRLFRAWWRPFYQLGLLHGDPHLGNYTVCHKTHAINLLDFGCVRVFAPRVIEGILLLFKGLQQKDEALMHKAYTKIGFQKLSPALMKALNLWAGFLYAPLLDDTKRPLMHDISGDEGRAVALQVHQILRAEGGVMPPREFVFLDRAAVGIGSALTRLGVQLNWHRLFLDLTQDFHAKTMQEKQNQLLNL